MRRLIRAGDTGAHVAPDKLTVEEWVDRWLALLQRKSDDADGAQVRRRGLVNPRTAERYGELSRLYVKPTLGARPLQKLAASEIDALYVELEKRLSLRTVHHVHTVLKACLNVAVRKKLVATNPAADAEAPAPEDGSAGQVCDGQQLAKLVQGFRNSAIYLIVAVAAFTGARRNEILALRWSDLDAEAKTLRIERAIEETEEFGRVLKEPKTERGKRTIQIDDDLSRLLLAERDRHLQLAAGIPDGCAVDLSLMKLPAGALMFPSFAGEQIDLTRLRNPRAVTHEFSRQAQLYGFPGLRFHDLRGSHETALLDAGVPVHVVAARCGHDPAVLLRTYAKRTRKADISAAAAIEALSKAGLG